MFNYLKKTGIPDPTIKIGDYNCGDIDPTTCRKIIYICYQTPLFLVTIDSSHCLNWFAGNGITYAKDFGAITSQVGLTEALVDRIFVGKSNKMAYKKLLGDVLSQLLDDGTSDTASAILKEVKERVLLHSKERIRMAYINYAILGVLLTTLLLFITLFNKSEILGYVNDMNMYKTSVSILLGGIGAFVSTFARFKNYQGHIVAGLPIHRLDGFLRVVYGLVAGLIISLAIKSEVFAGFADNGQPWLLYFFAIVAGASEVLIPNLIKQIEDKKEVSAENVVPAEAKNVTPVHTKDTNKTATDVKADTAAVSSTQQQEKVNGENVAATNNDTLINGEYIVNPT